jgi:hypothetical protein
MVHRGHHKPQAISRADREVWLMLGRESALKLGNPPIEWLHDLLSALAARRVDSAVNESHPLSED